MKRILNKKQMISGVLAVALLIQLFGTNVLAAEESLQNSENISEETIVEDWPEAPSELGDPAQWVEPDLQEREIEDELYGEPKEAVTFSTFSLMQKESLELSAHKDPAKEILDGEISRLTEIYLNGEKYTGGNLTVTEGDSFSYIHKWNPELNEDEHWTEGSWFKTEIFQVPGLNLQQHAENSLMINGIKVGSWEINYDRSSGKMTYEVIFNRYIQLFSPDSIMAFLQGSGVFSSGQTGGTIKNDMGEGTLTIVPKPSIPETSGGTGWQSSPGFNNRVYAFGKGVKWNSSNNPGTEPQVEWRIVFLEHLQKLQKEFYDSGNQQLDESSSYCIIEDTLDKNQEFFNPVGEKNFYGTTPFYLELPVMVPGTGNLLNGLSDIGDENYQGPGELSPVFSGDNFTEIDGSQAETKEEIAQIQEKVKNTPLSWTVTKDPKTHCQTLLINAGKLGTTDRTQGVTWNSDKLAIRSWDQKKKWPVKGIEEKIRECEEKIVALGNGTDSPLSLLDQRTTSLYQLLNTGIGLQSDENKKKELEEKVRIWESDYRTWHSYPEINSSSPLEDGNGVLIHPLPKQELLDAMKGTVVKKEGTILENTQEYKNYVKSLSNLQKDHKTYLNNKTKYIKDWEGAKGRYEKAKAFYEEGRVYGFVVKVRSRSINVSADTYKNSAEIQWENKKWSDESVNEIRFSNGIVGNFDLGEIVLQKADAFYRSDQNDEQIIQKIESDQAGLVGAKFQVYCGETVGEDAFPELTADNLAHFLDRDASAKGDTYAYTHTGKDHIDGVIEGDVETLEVNDDGKLLVSRLSAQHDHWLVETEAPNGYYLDQTPVLVNSENGKIVYRFLPNVSRSVIVYKTDSYSGHPVQGAEFVLYRQSEGQKMKVTGFAKKNLNGHEVFFKNDSGKEDLLTNQGGTLCIHGLEEGTYILEEINPAPGYLPTQSAAFTFYLSGELPKLDEERRDSQKQQYDRDYHLLLTTQKSPLKNDPGTGKVSLKKIGNENLPLKEAGFGLFRFTGTEAQWEREPNNEALWKSVDFHGTSYFKTNNTTGKVTLPEEGGSHAGQEVEAVFSEDDGKVTIDEIPLGHYSISEVKAPASYERIYDNFYFTIDQTNVGKEALLYYDIAQKKPLKDNTLRNYQKKAKLALVKYDGAEKPPLIQGTALGKGWQYTEEIFQEGNQTKGLEGAVYKLFMRRGGTVGEKNPDPEQLKTEEILNDRPGFDTFVAVGTTDSNGVLKLSAMKGRNQTEISGLNPGNYYMIEIKAPDGYVTDQTPIPFVLDDSVFSEDENVIPGLVMTAKNQAIEYGIRLVKAARNAEGDGETLKGLEAGFQMKKDQKLLWFQGSPGQYSLTEENAKGADSTIYTDTEGRLSITGLEINEKYFLEEVCPPKGYQKITTPVEVSTVQAGTDGKLEGNVLYPKEDQIIYNDRLKGEVVLHKQEAETAKSLAGAEFSIYRTIFTPIKPGDPDYDPKHPEAVRSEDIFVKKGITDENGNLKFQDLEWSDHYFLQETKAPDGYLLDRTRFPFVIDETSFENDGTAIPVLFPVLLNRKGVLGEAVLHKRDADDPNKPLADACFYLEKRLGTDASGQEIWVGYGRGEYITDSKGELHLLLPPGQYKLTETKAPDGYLLEEQKELLFTISDKGSAVPFRIDDGDNDGIVKNKKGEAAVSLKKKLKGTDIPVKGVTFSIGWTKEDPLYFVQKSDGSYRYTKDQTETGSTAALITNAEGVIYAEIPPELKPEETQGSSKLYCWEVKAPDGLVQDTEMKEISLEAGVCHEIVIENELKPGAVFSISIHKKDAKSRVPLEKAEFTLYRYDESRKEQKDSHREIGKGVTDKNGNLIFDDSILTESLKIGEIYHLVETKAPDGYATDHTHHEIVLDERYLDEDFHFKGIERTISNNQISGSVRLKKVDEKNREKGLAGAEFELLRQVKKSDPTDDPWEHYGENRYVTDEKGEILIKDLPYGTYQLVERAAPLGYVMEDAAPSVRFRIEEEGKTVELEPIGNSQIQTFTKDVKVRKVSAEDPSKVLKGAEFQLYFLAADGNYRLYQQKIYETDAEGNFTIEDLPVGNYGFKEVRAPKGYELPKQDMTYFSVKDNDEFISLQIENRKEKENGSAGENQNKEDQSGSSGTEIYAAQVSPTGDSANIFFWSGLLFVALTGIVFIFIRIFIKGKGKK